MFSALGRVNKIHWEILTSVGFLRPTRSSQVIVTGQVGLLLQPSGDWRRNRVIRKDLLCELLQQADCFLLLDVRLTSLQLAVSGLDVLAILKVHL